MARPIPPSDSSPERDADPGTWFEDLPPESLTKWPGSVPWPASPCFEQSAKAWLFDLAPARWMYEDMLHRHPVELARMVRLRLEADVVAMQAGLRAVGEPLWGRTPAQVPPLSDLYTRERDWARSMLEQVKLVEQCLKAVRDRARRGKPAVAGSAAAQFPRPRHATG